MNRWENLGGESKPKENLEQVVLEGFAANCQTCNEQVDKGVYLPNQQILTWKCSKGHKSFIEKFSI